jgi:ribosomal protein S18 acetylase RimI-like enzyme
MSGHKKFILRVAVKNEAAIALYKQFGFQTVSYLKNYYKDFSTNPKENDAYKMELKFSV